MAQQAANAAPLTVVLVHGAYADASSWNGVIMVSQPGTAADVIMTAAAAVHRPAAADGA